MRAAPAPRRRPSACSRPPPQRRRRCNKGCMNDGLTARQLSDRPPISVNYAAASPGADRKPVTSVALTISLSLIYLFILFLALGVAPRIEMILRDFKAEIPTLGAWVLLACRWIRSDFGWALLLTVPFLLPIA